MFCMHSPLEGLKRPGNFTLSVLGGIFVTKRSSCLVRRGVDGMFCMHSPLEGLNRIDEYPTQ